VQQQQQQQQLPAGPPRLALMRDAKQRIPR